MVDIEISNRAYGLEVRNQTTSSSLFRPLRLETDLENGDRITIYNDIQLVELNGKNANDKLGEKSEFIHMVTGPNVFNVRVISDDLVSGGIKWAKVRYRPRWLM